MAVTVYSGWNIPSTLHIFSKKEAVHYPYPQAMIASSDKKQAIDTAKKWASNKYDNWTDNDYIEYEIENKDIELELLDSASGSSQGGKLSFWNCIISKQDMNVVVGVSSDLLIELLKNSDFEHGKCKQKIMMARYDNKWGALTEDMDLYKEAVKDVKAKEEFKNAKKTNKWELGYEYYSKTQKDIYLYDVYKWINIDYPTWYSTKDIKIYARSKPERHKYTWSDYMYKDYRSLSEYINKAYQEGEIYTYLDRLFNRVCFIKHTLPYRVKGEKVFDMDMNSDQLNKLLLDYRKMTVDKFMAGDERDFSSVLNAFSYSLSPQDMPEIPKECLKKASEKYNYHIEFISDI